MGWKRSLAIHFGYWLYLAFGGLVFYFVELPLQGKQITPSSPKSVYHGGRADLIHRDVNFCQSLEEEIHRRIHLQQNVSVDLAKTWTTAMKGLVHESCANLTRRRQLDPSLSLTEENQVNPWDYSTAIYLSMTILTTIGYGDYSPLTTGGRIFCIFYGFIGIPITGLFLKTTTDFFSEKLLGLYERQRKKREEKGKRIFSAAAVFLVPGLIAFLFIPAAILTAIEDWNYFDAIYFSFVSLTTIGFGDMTTGKNVKSSLLGFYRICLTSWVLAGIAYWAIVIVFISKAFKFKRVRKRWLLKKEAIERLRSGLLQQQKLAIKDLQSKTASNIHINNTLPVIDEPTGADGGGPTGSKEEQDPRQTGFLTRARATAAFLKAYMLGRKEAPPVTSNLQDTEMTCQAHSSNDRAAAFAQEILESSSAFEELPQSDQREQQRQLEMMQKLLSEAMSILEQEGGSDGGGNDSDIRGSSRNRDDEDVERIRFTASS